VIICGETQREIALLVDEVLDLRPLDVDHLLAAESRARCALVEEDLWVLDARALLADARLSEEREATSQDIRGA
jgi:chemotaxis signal transduction protein